MGDSKRYTFMKILVATTWTLIGIGTVVLLVAAVNRKKGECCRSVDIHITGVQNNYFIDKGDVSTILGKFSHVKLEGKPIHSFNLSAMENALQKNEWIKRAELYF